MRSALTVLGVVIGITSIVGMTALIRGFDQSLRDSIAQLGPNTIFVQQFGALSFAGGQEFLELLRRPNLTHRRRARDRARLPVGRARRRRARRGGHAASRACSTATRRRKQLGVLGATENFVGGELREARARPLLQRHRSRAPAATSSCSATRRSRRCSPNGSIRSARWSASAASGSRSSACSTSGRARRVLSGAGRLRRHPVHARTSSIFGRSAGLGDDQRGSVDPASFRTSMIAVRAARRRARQATRWPRSSASCASATA